MSNPPNAIHISPIDQKGIDAVASSPGHRIGMRPGCCLPILLRTTSSTTSTLGARNRSLSGTGAISKRKDLEE